MNKWVKIVSDEAGPPDPDHSLLSENEWLRRVNRIRKEERELLKKGPLWSLERKQSVFDENGAVQTFETVLTFEQVWKPTKQVRHQRCYFLQPRISLKDFRCKNVISKA